MSLNDLSLINYQLIEMIDFVVIKINCQTIKTDKLCIFRHKQISGLKNKTMNRSKTLPYTTVKVYD